ncbi:RNA repair domain-containing protein [Nonomuraea purpurea]|uniref:RNA repair domain-containing protein n=1 Tax=Nonomuraea purpurea TaxID=1849276 RepID=A0ABV8G7Y6_9ACTN
MRTSEEIYHRIRWDPRFDPSRFVLGVGQRDAAPKRIPLPAFAPGGDVPWHRVLFVEADGVLVWDRATRLDLVDTCDAGRARDPRLLRAPFFTARTPHAWDAAGGWRPGSRPATPSADVLRFLTWNTLWNRYDSELIDTARRRPLLLAALEEADADVIALQEVEPALLEMLLTAAWVRARYTVGTDPGGADVDDSGLLLLSRLPVREAAWHELGPHKAVAAIAIDTAGGPLVAAVTHLTSDHTGDGAARRAELDRIAEGLAGVEGDLVLLGDFNDGTDAPATVLGLRDAWTQAHGADQTPTSTLGPTRWPRCPLCPGGPRGWTGSWCGAGLGWSRRPCSGTHPRPMGCTSPTTTAWRRSSTSRRTARTSMWRRPRGRRTCTPGRARSGRARSRRRTPSAWAAHRPPPPGSPRSPAAGPEA